MIVHYRCREFVFTKSMKEKHVELTKQLRREVIIARKFAVEGFYCIKILIRGLDISLFAR